MTELLARGIAVALCVTAARAEEPPAPDNPAWTGSVSAMWYLLPDEGNYVLPIVIAQRDRLHIEARYNYEDRNTGSIFGGWLFEAGTEVEFSATPMLGAVVGRTDGIAPGCTVEVSWRQLSLYSENEYVFDFADSRQSFFYNWSELAWDPLDWLSVGMVTQRTRVYETDRELQRGLMARYTMGRWAAAGYWFNPGSDDHFAIVSLSLDL